MIQKTRTVALSTIAVAAVVAVFAFAPIVADMMQAHAFFGGRGGQNQQGQNDNSQGSPGRFFGHSGDGNSQ